MAGAGQPPRIAAGALVAAGMVASAISLTTLVAPPSWLVDTVLGVAAVAVAGMLARARFTALLPVLLIQLASLVLVLGWLFGADADGSTLWLGVLPSPSTVGLWADLLAQARALIEVSAAPVPPEPGVALLVVASVCLLAILADLLVVTLESPALGGSVLLIPFLTAVANSDGSLAVPYFVLPAVAWLALLVEHDRRLLSGWWPTPRSSAPGRPVTPDVASHRWGTAVALGSAGLVLALLVASVAPRLPVRYLAEGLGRSTGGSTQVGFSPDLDMLADLRNTSDTAVLTYRTDDPTPPYLRVAVSVAYNTGSWQPAAVAAQPSSTPQLPAPYGLSDRVARTQYELTVEQTALAEPFLATPYPLTQGTVTDARWGVDPTTGIAVADRTPTRYTLSYLEPEPSWAALSRRTSPGVFDNDPELAGTRSLTLPVAETLDRFLPSTVSDAPTSYARAVALQQWLRSPAFRYSLELAPIPAGMSAGEAAATSLERFLQSKRGYCVQYATTMALAARFFDIPSRVVTGFLPGTRDGDQWVVRARDAHAWPELYFPGIGWLPFEPTPADRAVQAPGYSTPTTAATSSPDEAAPTTDAEPVPTATDPARDPRDRDRTDTDLAVLDEGEGWPGWLRLVLTGLGLVGLLLVVPITAWLTRRRELARARSEAEQVEVAWRTLTSRLADLGLATPASMTLPEQRRHLRRAALLEAEPDAALGRLTDAVEQARYAPSPAAPHGLAADAATVLAAAAQLRSRRARWRAQLWPNDGRRALAQVVRVARFRAPGRR